MVAKHAGGEFSPKTCASLYGTHNLRASTIDVRKSGPAVVISCKSMGNCRADLLSSAWPAYVFVAADWNESKRLGDLDTAKIICPLPAKHDAGSTSDCYTKARALIPAPTLFDVSKWIPGDSTQHFTSAKPIGIPQYPYHVA